MKKFILGILSFLIVGCGYAPIGRISDNILEDKIFVDVFMNKIDPQNTVAIKDAVKDGIIYRLHKELSDKKNANNFIIASINHLSFSPLTYDQYGYATSYRVNLVLAFEARLKDGRVVRFSGSGDHDFRVTRLLKNARDTSSIISDQERYEAIKNASTQAFDEFIAVLGIESLKSSEFK
ncbi:penicillin-binding protein [Campylobacter sp. FMV-PI01]|uniref:Penicillin-binding protein n=1 Tax=Campylobacter portucalensis TaxID=2608384 RepID=A0A6L5WIH4_9BACT|nr:LPS assembly lipoprotein LptE [Campylobacter portucalensis]MSN96057.1 penicillin-binding protein [Campylobacter portucalensis]